MPVTETAWMIIRGWPKIVLQCEQLKEPSILELKYGSSGAIEVKGATASLRTKK
jgi:hypothetical protein